MLPPHPCDGPIFSVRSALTWLSRFQLQNPLVAQGYPVFSAIFYLGVGMMVGSIALCAYVAHNFKTNNFPYVWPIKVRPCRHPIRGS